MNLVDVLIVLLVISSFLRGYTIGLVRQAGSTVGFIAGLFAGSLISNAVVSHIDGSLNKSLSSLLIVLVCSFICMSVGEMIGVRLKEKVTLNKSLDVFDGGFGSVMSAATVLFAVWLGAAILILGPTSGLQQAFKNSRIISTLNAQLPPATKFFSTINKLVDPNGFPQVFRGLEPSPSTTSVPSIGSLQNVVNATQASVVKVEGTGCGGIVEGSGFVFGSGNTVATNAHVIAGVAEPKVIDANGVHDTRVVWFDSDMDLAVLRVGNLAGKPLSINSTEQASGTPAVVLGYPGGGDFDAEAAAVLDNFNAYGRDIYGQKTTVRDIYSVQAKIIPGNSGGPLVGSDGSVLGIVFATSTTYNNVGYALTGHQVIGQLTTAEHSTTTYSTGSCSE